VGGCSGRTVVSMRSACSVTSATGTCGNAAGGLCNVCDAGPYSTVAACGPTPCRGRVIASMRPPCYVTANEGSCGSTVGVCTVCAVD
jgi:hypothetical protein